LVKIHKEKPLYFSLQCGKLFALKIQLYLFYGQKGDACMKTAVLGYGTVGKGLVRQLERGQALERGPVLVRPGKEKEPFHTARLEDILADASVAAVAEAMGGEEPAFSYLAAALRAGKHIVTANKALVAARGPELAAMAREQGRAFLFSAACGGGVPVLHNLSLAAQNDRITALGGVVNGTANYILDAMQGKGQSFTAALAQAQELGFAEADPSADLSGLDTLRKLQLLCAVGFSVLPAGELLLEGIEHFTAEDAADLARRGLRCRLTARAGRCESGLFAFVQPMLYGPEAPEYALPGSENLIWYQGECAGTLRFRGQGAGGAPTASAMARDLCDIAQGRREMLPADCQRELLDGVGPMLRYYVRLPEGGEGAFPGAEVCRSGGVCRLITRPMGAAELHRSVQRLRLLKNEVFFAGWEEA